MISNPTGTVADFMARLDYDDLPSSIRSRVLAIVIDALACAVLGRDGPETTRMERLAFNLSGAGTATVIGSPDRHSLAGAALVNGYQITAFNLCDVYRPAHYHMSPVVIPPAVTVAEQRHSSGKELLAAVAAGLETACRVGSAIDFETFREQGWHSPGIIGPFGGAAAAGRLYELNPDAMRNALGLAGSQSAGTMAHWGTPTIKFHQSRGALSGLISAILAVEGYSAGANVFADSKGGVLANYSNGGRPELLTDGLGERWELMNISLKRWPSGSGLQTTVTTLFDLIDQHDIEPEAVEEVRVTLPSHAYGAHAQMEWGDKFEAMLSARYITAVILHDRRCWVDQFDDDRRQDRAIDAFARDRVRVKEDPTLSSSAALTEISFRDGSILRDVREGPKGDPTDPLELDEVIDKYRDTSESSGGSQRALERLVSLAEIEDVAPVISLLRPDPVTPELE